jgi:A/G-specific adenine glycosylase
VGKYQAAVSQLEQWFERQKRVLPWRNRPTVYRVWISEIMLQQTQVATVVPYFERFIDRFPTVEALAVAPLDDVLFHWAGLGYYSRARNLHRAAQQILNQGGFPKDREGWLQIPGVGEYTAGAILSIAYDQPEAILDGNVERVLSRLRRVGRQRGDAAFKSRLWRLSRTFVEGAFQQKIPPSVTNQALMELGATVCSPKRPKCLLCPLASVCRAREHGDMEAFPPKKKPKTWIEVREELHCLLDGEGRLLLRKRGSEEWRTGLWDLLDDKPSPKLGKILKLGSVNTKHVVTRHKITRTTHVWKLAATTQRGTLLRASEAAGGQELRWVSISAPDVAVGSALSRTLREIHAQLSDFD